MKLIGIFIIFSACSLTGFMYSQKYKLKIDEIKRAEVFIKTIVFCLKNDHMSTPEIFDCIYSSCDETTKKFVESIRKNCFNNIEETAKECGFCCDKSTIQILNEAFFVFGKYSAEEQIYELEICRNKLKSLYEKNFDSLSTKSKLSLRFGVICGLLFVLILI